MKCVVVYLDLNELFCFIYGDGVFDIDIISKIVFYCEYGKMVIVMVV